MARKRRSTLTIPTLIRVRTSLFPCPMCPEDQRRRSVTTVAALLIATRRGAGPTGPDMFFALRMAGSEPCQEYKDWIQQKHGRPWTPRPSGGGRAPSSAPPAPPSAAAAQPTATVLSEDQLLRTAAGTFTPADMFETLVDSCGCANLVDDEWAQEKLRLPIQTDNSDRGAKIPSTGLAGSQAYFKQYVDVDALCGATPVKMRFYLSTKLPRPLLLGNPFCLNRVL
mmetsp:Transcript_108014/g.247701  ORF Transcript_108014/g.247701 Transcript_108014/m.247701 type:complete len:225 (-) Transcript_108014:556-1230(-)